MAKHAGDGLRAHREDLSTSPAADDRQCWNSPGGATGSSPAIHRWDGEQEEKPRPGGMTESLASGHRAVDGELDRLVNAVLASSKYRYVCEELVRGIGARELARRRNLKRAIKATRSALHQVGGAYLGGGIEYPAALEQLNESARSAGREDWRAACSMVMRCHVSTRERLPILDQFYETVLAGMGPIRSVLDLACGLHPLSIPWMPLAPDAEYYACDIYADMVGFLNRFLALTQVRGQAWVADVTRSCPDQKADVAFLLKTLPCLEQLDGTCPLRLLDEIRADHLLVSFPVHSLGGRRKGMSVNYEARFQDLIADRSWSVERFVFATELVFRINR